LMRFKLTGAKVLQFEKRQWIKTLEKHVRDGISLTSFNNKALWAKTLEMP
jgi:hypothetical protein